MFLFKLPTDEEIEKEYDEIYSEYKGSLREFRSSKIQQAIILNIFKAVGVAIVLFILYKLFL